MKVIDGLEIDLIEEFSLIIEAYLQSGANLRDVSDGNNWKTITTKPAAGNSNEQIRYSYIDNNLSEIVYYRLQQYDIDGKSETFGPIVVTRDVTDKKIIGYINLLGQKVDPKYTTGVIIEIYDDGTMVKKIK